MKTITTLKTLFILAIGLSMSLSLIAQPEGRERIQQMKIAFMTERLDLSVDEAQAFWPIYNEHEEQIIKLVKEIRQDHRFIKDGSDVITEDQLLSKITTITKKRNQVNALDEKFIRDCIPVLGAKKSARILALEDEFKKEVLKRLKNRGPDGPPGRP